MLFYYNFILRVVQTQAILKSMSERVGSDIQRLWNWVINMIDDDEIEIQSRYMSEPTLSDIGFKNRMAWVWTTLKFWDHELENKIGWRSLDGELTCWIIVRTVVLSHCPPPNQDKKLTNEFRIPSRSFFGWKKVIYSLRMWL